MPQHFRLVNCQCYISPITQRISNMNYVDFFNCIVVLYWLTVCSLYYILRKMHVYICILPYLDSRALPTFSCRQFQVALELGCGRGRAALHLFLAGATVLGSWGTHPCHRNSGCFGFYKMSKMSSFSWNLMDWWFLMIATIGYQTTRIWGLGFESVLEMNRHGPGTWAVRIQSKYLGFGPIIW